MSSKLALKGRFGYYAPRNPEERAKARRQESTRQASAANAAAWLERNRWCKNGCGKPAAMYEGPYPSLRFSGCCSRECEAAIHTRGSA